MPGGTRNLPGARRIAAALAAAFALFSASAPAIDASNRYRSPRNPERRIRQSTELIVLHTTEAAARGSLKKLSERGECHYCVTEEGEVYRIVDRDREAFHAGRSMWNGKEDVDKFSIGIECVGYHDKAMPLAQLGAIRELVDELKSMYNLTDDKVVSHSHVAYGSPNKWHPSKHRGRKQCGMLFAMPSVRRMLGLKSRVGADPDVRAKRLVVGDEYLEKVLYGKVDTMRGTYGKDAVAAAPAAPAATGAAILGWLGLNDKPKAQISSPKPAGSASRPGSQSAKRKPQAVRTVTKPATARSATAAKGAKGTPKRQNQKPKPQKTPKPSAPTSIAALKQQGFTLRGTVSPYYTAMRIAGGKWNSPDTYYTIRNKVIPGNLINPAKIEKGMGIWMK